MWVKTYSSYFEYIAVVVDNLLVFSKDPTKTPNQLMNDFKVKLEGIGPPTYYNRADVVKDKADPRKGWLFSAETYVNNVIKKIGKMFDCKLKKIQCTMDPGDRLLEADKSEFLNANEKK